MTALRQELPRKLYFGLLVYLTAAWLAVIAVDLVGVGGLRGDRLVGLTDRPLLFVFLFGEGGPTEILQWCCLIVVIIVLLRELRTAGVAVEPHHRLATLVGFVGVTLMFLEDTLNVRHFLTGGLVGPLLGASAESHRFAIVTEFAFYALLGGTMLAFFVMIFPRLSRTAHGGLFLLMGYVLYAVAAISSASRHIGRWYTTVGDAILSRLSPDAVAEFDQWLIALRGASDVFTPGFYFMDFAVEETIELLGAGALMAAVLYLRLDTARSSSTEDSGGSVLGKKQ